MIDISFKIHFQKNYMIYKYYIDLVDVVFRHEKLLLTRRELPTVALSYHVKIR